MQRYYFNVHYERIEEDDEGNLVKYEDAIKFAEIIRTELNQLLGEKTS